MRYHPRYSYSDGDVLLESNDGTIFRLHSFILKIASPWFRGLLDMPRAATEKADDPIPVYEDASALATAFDILYPHDDVEPAVGDLDTAWKVCRVADKFELSRVEAYVRNHLTKRPPYTVKDKLKLYLMACEFDWSSVRDFAAHCAISANEAVIWTHYSRLIEQLDAPNFVRLLALQHRRQQKIVKCVDEKHFQWVVAFAENDYWTCPRPCASTQIPYTELASTICTIEDIARGNLNRDPTGKTLTTVTFWECFRDLLKTMRCHQCEHAFIDAKQISMIMSNVIERLDGPEHLAHVDLGKERTEVLTSLCPPPEAKTTDSELPETKTLLKMLVEREMRISKLISTLNSACDLHVLQEIGLYGAVSEDGIYWECRGPDCGKKVLQ